MFILFDDIQISSFLFWEAPPDELAGIFLSNWNQKSAFRTNKMFLKNWQVFIKNWQIFNIFQIDQHGWRILVWSAQPNFIYLTIHNMLDEWERPFPQ